MHIQDLKKLKYNNYIQINWPDNNPNQLIFGRVIHVSDTDLTYLQNTIVWTEVYPVYGNFQHHWNYNQILKYVLKIIDDPGQCKFIKLLYDKS